MRETVIPEASKTWKEWFRHAFALDGVAEPLSEADAVLLDKIAQGVVQRRMTTPALLFLESVKPLSFIGSQTLVFFGPLLEMILKREEIERGAKLLERRDVLETMALRIETLEGERRG